jgi:DNA-directed RNA polymerase subunit K/omega
MYIAKYIAKSMDEVVVPAAEHTKITSVAEMTTTPCVTTCSLFSPLTPPHGRFLTRFELARVVGTRALQISQGAQIRVDAAGVSSDPIALALRELRARALDLVVRRRLPDGSVENVRVSDLILDESAIDVL